jgi:hypothetical protein
MRNDKNMRMLTRNDKMTTNNIWVLKMHFGNVGCTRLDVILRKKVIGGTIMLKVKTFREMDIMLEDTKGTKYHIMDVINTRVENILHYIFCQTKDHWKTWCIDTKQLSIHDFLNQDENMNMPSSKFRSQNKQNTNKSTTCARQESNRTLL